MTFLILILVFIVIIAIGLPISFIIGLISIAIERKKTPKPPKPLDNTIVVPSKDCHPQKIEQYNKYIKIADKIDPNYCNVDQCECCLSDRSRYMLHNVHGIHLCGDCWKDYLDKSERKLLLVRPNAMLSPYCRTMFQTTNQFDVVRQHSTVLYCDACGINITISDFVKFWCIDGIELCSVCAKNRHHYDLPSRDSLIRKYNEKRRFQNNLINFEKEGIALNYCLDGLENAQVIHSERMFLTENAMLSYDMEFVIPFQSINKVKEFTYYVNRGRGHYEFRSAFRISTKNIHVELKNISREEIYWFLYNYSDKFDPNCKIVFLNRKDFIYYSVLKEKSKKYDL